MEHLGFFITGLRLVVNVMTSLIFVCGLSHFTRVLSVRAQAGHAGCEVALDIRVC